MKANELRIGNLVHAYKTTWSVDSSDFCRPEIIETYKPIPLTEEWLVKLGFNKDRSTRDLLFDYIIYFERQNDNLYLCNNQTRVQYLIEWVHEAQNIHFALTGEELV